MLVATGVLFYVSYWLLSKMEVVKWNHFVKSKVAGRPHGRLDARAGLRGLPRGLSRGLRDRAVLQGAVRLRHGRRRDTGCGGHGRGGPAGRGIHRHRPVRRAAAAQAVLRGHQRVLYYMAFVFAGKGVAELQEGGTSPPRVRWAPRIPALGIYPTAESLAAQGLLVLLALGAGLDLRNRAAPPCSSPDPSRGLRPRRPRFPFYLSPVSAPLPQPISATHFPTA